MTERVKLTTDNIGDGYFKTMAEQKDREWFHRHRQQFMHAVEHKGRFTGMYAALVYLGLDEADIDASVLSAVLDLFDATPPLERLHLPNNVALAARARAANVTIFPISDA